MEHSNHSSSAPGAGGAGQGTGRSGVPADSTKKRGAADALTSPDRKRQMLASALQTGAVDNSAPVVIDEEVLGDLLRTFSVPEPQLAPLLADTALRQHLTNIARRGLQHQGIGGTAGPQSASVPWSIDLNLPDVFNAWDSLCVLYQTLRASNAMGAPSAMLMAARSLRRLQPSERRTARVAELLEACKQLMRDSTFVKGRAEVADAYSIVLALLPTAEAPAASGPGAPEPWRAGDPMGNGTGVVPIAANGEWRMPAEEYALSLLEAMLNDANVKLPLNGDGPEWTNEACTAVLDVYMGKQLPEEVVLTDLFALEALLRGAVHFNSVPFSRYLVWHDLLRGLRKRVGRRAEGAAPALQLAFWIRNSAVHEKVNQLPALVSRYVDLPEVSRADLPQRDAALQALRRLLGELEIGQLSDMPEVLGKVFAALDVWDMKDMFQKTQLLVRSARLHPQAKPGDTNARQTQLLNRALGYCLSNTLPAPPADKSLVARLVPDLMALPAPIRLEWLDRFFAAVGAHLPPMTTVLAASASSPLTDADVAQALNWVAAPSLPVVRAFPTSFSAQIMGTTPEQMNRRRDIVANDELQFQLAAVMWLQLVSYAPASQLDAVGAGLTSWVAREHQRDPQAWLMQMQPIANSLGDCLRRLPEAQAQALIAGCVRGIGAMTAAPGPLDLRKLAWGRWLWETLTAYQVALGRERVPDLVLKPTPPLVQRIFQAWPRLRIQQSSDFMAWVRKGPISMSAAELAKIQLEWGGFWGPAMRHQATLVQSVMTPVRGRPI